MSLNDVSRCLKLSASNANNGDIVTSQDGEMVWTRLDSDMMGLIIVPDKKGLSVIMII